MLAPFDRHDGPVRNSIQTIIASGEDGGIADSDAGEDAARTMLAAFDLLVKSGTACENASKVMSVSKELTDISNQMSAMLEKVVRVLRCTRTECLCVCHGFTLRGCVGARTVLCCH